MHRAGIILGILAVLALLGTLSLLPPPIAFFVCALAIILFPGIAVTELACGPGKVDRSGSRRISALGQMTPPESLALWFVIGTGVISLIGFAGHLFKLRLSDITTILVVAYAVLVVLMILRAMRGRSDAPQSGTASEAASRRAGPGIYIGLASVAIGSGFVTLFTQRDYDDWYYLAYIRDYVVNKPLGLENGIFGPAEPLAPRFWFGGGWWALEALLSRVSGVDPITCHQVYLPLMLVAFAVLACFMLSRQIFRSQGAALAACSLQFLFYVSSAFPFKGAGWSVICRIAQDKMVSCFVIVPVAVALAVKLINRLTEDRGEYRRTYYLLFCGAVATSLLVHGLGPVWCGVLIVPFAVIEWLRARKRIGAVNLFLLLLPIGLAGLLLMLGRGAVLKVVVAPTPEPVPLLEHMAGVYLPGDPHQPATETVYPTVWIWREWFRILHPLFIIRYPLAMLGFALSWVLLYWGRRSPAARFLMGGTFLVFFLVYTPAGAELAAWFMTWRLLFRLSLLFPWGLVIAFFITRPKVRPVVTWLVILVIALAICRGDPRNYVNSFYGRRKRNRPYPTAVDAFRYLGSRPSPQGVVLAPEGVGRMIGGFLPDAYPVNFREYGPVDREKLEELMDKKWIDRMLREVLRRNQVNYILLEHNQPLAKTLRESDTGFELMYENDIYAVWQVVPARP
ncbi:DUF6077 domain-containing protein [Candidatus Eisenbacteria bacterium]|uniref:DUF6077 domain-containing protein n=1 Tax=Eiseniibacteriota bacterium TaxID=2212470 RepID=A0ABV6YQ52_UNCEI